MPLTTNQQNEIQSMVESSSPEQLKDLKEDAEFALRQLKRSLDHRLLSNIEMKQFEMAVEFLTSLETTQLGKAFWYRSKRRYQIAKMYLP